MMKPRTKSNPRIIWKASRHGRFENARNQHRVHCGQLDICYIGVVAWNKLAESCNNMLKKGNAVLVDGELQNRTWKTDDGNSRSIVEIKARRIQFLNKKGHLTDSAAANGQTPAHEEEPASVEDDSFDKFLSSEESQLLKGDQ